MKLQHREEEEKEHAPVSTSISKSSGPSINLGDYQLSLSPSTERHIATRSNQPMTSIDSSMALTLLFLFTVILFLGFFSIYIPCYSRQRSEEIAQQRRRQERASSNARSLPLFVYGGSEEVNERMDCAICLTEFEEKETVRMIPYCGHLFHQQCIDAWFYSKVSCPLCRSTQLFRLSSRRKMEGSSLSELEEGRLHDHDSAVRSADGREDTWREGQVADVRRVSSCSSLTERVSLPRSSSF